MSPNHPQKPVKTTLIPRMLTRWPGCPHSPMPRPKLPLRFAPMRYKLITSNKQNKKMQARSTCWPLTTSSGPTGPGPRCCRPSSTRPTAHICGRFANSPFVRAGPHLPWHPPVLDPPLHTPTPPSPSSSRPPAHRSLSSHPRPMAQPEPSSPLILVLPFTSFLPRRCPPPRARSRTSAMSCLFSPFFLGGDEIVPRTQRL